MKRRLQLLTVCAMALLVGSLAMARDQALLSKAVSESNSERAGAERLYRKTERQQRASATGEARAIKIEIGDELGSSQAANTPEETRGDVGYQEKGSSKKLEREWREVNRELSDRSAISRASISGNSGISTRPGRNSGRGDPRSFGD